MLSRLLIALLCFCFVSSYAGNGTVPNPGKTKAYATLPAFNSIHSNGYVHVIITQAKTNRPVAKFTNRNPKRVSAYVDHLTLYIKELPHQAGSKVASNKPAIVLVTTNRLSRILAYGKTSVTGVNLRSNNLSITADTSGDITLSGVLALSKIWSTGPGKINLRWIDSKRLNIDNLGSGSIQLAGIVTYLHARTLSHATLNLQFLRAKTAWVQTKDYSTAKIMAVDTLRAFADDNSNLYYYKKPTHFTHFSTGSGSILQLQSRK